MDKTTSFHMDKGAKIRLSLDTQDSSFFMRFACVYSEFGLKF